MMKCWMGKDHTWLTWIKKKKIVIKVVPNKFRENEKFNLMGSDLM